MATVHLRVEPASCGPASVGTVGLVKLVRQRFGLSLAEAKGYVGRCVFGGETVAPADAVAVFASEVTALESPAKFHVSVEAG